MRGRGALAYFLAFTDADANLDARNLVSRSPTGDRLLHRPSDVHLTLESAASAWIMLMPSPTIHVRPASIDTFRIVFLPLPLSSSPIFYGYWRYCFVFSNTRSLLSNFDAKMKSWRFQDLSWNVLGTTSLVSDTEEGNEAWIELERIVAAEFRNGFLYGIKPVAKKV